MEGFSRVKTLCQFLIRFHIGRLTGAGLFVAALFLYRSYENRPVLGLWSYPFFLVILFAISIFVILFFSSLRSFRRECHTGTGFVSLPLLFLELAILFWGVAYFVSAIDDRRNGARIADLNIFGSVTPIAIGLEWFVLLFVFLILCTFTWRYRHYKWANLSLLFVTVAGFILLLEGVVRLSALIAPITQGFPTYTSSLWSRRYIKVNSNGFRDVEHSLSKREGTRRLLIVGDSYAFGGGINNIKNRFGEQLALILSAKTQENFEVINASRGDTHTLQHIEFLKQALAYNPDIVILLYVFNDIDYLCSVTPRLAYKQLHSRFSLTGLFYRNLYLFQELFIRLRLIGYNLAGNREKRSHPYQDRLLLSRHLKDISKFVELATKKGAFAQVVPFDISPAYRHRCETFVKSAQEFGIPIWPLCNAFERFQLSELVVNTFDAHPNETANSIAVGKIAKRILQQLSLYTNDKI